MIIWHQDIFSHHLKGNGLPRLEAYDAFLNKKKYIMDENEPLS